MLTVVKIRLSQVFNFRLSFRAIFVSDFNESQDILNLYIKKPPEGESILRMQGINLHGIYGYLILKG